MNIKVKANSLFKKLTDNINFSFNDRFNISELLDKKVLDLNIEKYYVQKKSDYLLLNKQIDLENYDDINDLSGMEWNENKIYLGFSDDFFEPTVILGRKVFDMYCDKISKFVQNEKIIVSMSIDYGEYKNIVIRFYKVRENEATLLLNDLELYKEDGMLVGYINF